MSLLSRGSERILLVLIPLAIITLVAIPVSWTVRAPWTAIGPSLAWAGSPDETLRPPPTPPRAGKRTIVASAHSETFRAPARSALSKMDAMRDTAKVRYFLYVLWRVSLATSVRN